MHPDRLARLPEATRPAAKAPKVPKPSKAPKTANPAPQAPKKSLFDDSDSDADDGGVQLKVNEEYAKRFEHNKKREERQKLEEKYKGDGDSESDSTSESEDEDAFLATEDLDVHISETLNALKSKDPRIYDKNVKFFPQKDTPETGPEKKKEKPVFLKDYHRERYLSGKANELPEDDDDADEGAPKTYVQEQADLKKSIVAEIKAAAESDEDAEADFLKPKEKSKKRKADKEDAASKREITQADIANAGDNPEAYLSNFMASRAWAAAPDGSNWQAFESDDGGDSDLEKADEIEAAYNMRFEDPTKSNEVLKSYARDVAAEKSVRREALTGRKRQRELEKERKAEAKRERAEEKARLKKLKLEEASVKLEKIRATAGLSGKSISDEELLQILEGAWEDDKWEEEMKKRFGEEYYAADDGASSSEEEDSDDEDPDKKKKKKKPKKPKWDDDIDITDVVGEDYVDAAPAITLSDIEDEGEDHGNGGGEDAESDDDEDSRPAKKRKSKDHKRERESARRAAKKTRQALDQLVSTKIELESPAILDPANKPEGQPAFRWRETSPRAFGMTSADILLAPSDAALNQFAGIKKYASWRDTESKRRDKKRLGKKARLRQWRRETFGKEFENGIVFDPAAAAAADRDAVDAKVEERGAEELAGEKKKRKRKRGHRKAAAADADGDVEMDVDAEA
ncbi:related to protein KRI1 [Cephalotrichum gorgonifer]|uniref:Related to protein KRI1 n=1 Tax=Cephalotrichum gorgonifer TaxID=2041049 RepID=A0AAE8SVH1_9PEZI|nr:related to protein KRI1 [Cephalotrichum gorgonifer]